MKMFSSEFESGVYIFMYPPSIDFHKVILFPENIHPLRPNLIIFEN